jgi:hypothetical protein
MEKKSASNSSMRRFVVSEWSLFHGCKTFGKSIEEVPEERIWNLSPDVVSLPVSGARQEMTYCIALCVIRNCSRSKFGQYSK